MPRGLLHCSPSANGRRHAFCATNPGNPFLLLFYIVNTTPNTYNWGQRFKKSQAGVRGMHELQQVMPGIVIMMAFIFVVIQVLAGLFALLRVLASPDMAHARSFLLTVAVLLASYGICHAKVFPHSFLHGLCSMENRVNLPLYLLSMFIGLLFSWELLCSRRNTFRTVGAFGLFFLVMNITPGLTDYAYQAQFKPNVRPASQERVINSSESIPAMDMARGTPRNGQDSNRT